MTAIKCKICGGDVSVSEGKTFGTCEYCGSTITLPKVSDEQRLALFNRGNHFRRIGEFDKALAIYENIVREDDTDAEAHWCCALSRFGIEYVEDPNTFEYLPTCHRASFDSFLEDVDFKAALEHSDGLTRRQYQKDAAKIAEVQRGILATSQNEEPYDVFICYKETDDQTRERTKDSVDAQEIYYQLTQEGYRVFFSRVTLEDKAGTEYEPYIFAALNSAKVMVVVGTKPEYFNAVWVKNEWSRFLSMMRKDRSKILLPCYKGMDPYDLPEQLSVLQSYDMTKIGFVQDLLRGIKKIVNKNTGETATPKEASSIETGAAILNAQTSALLKRGYMCLEDKDFEKAEDFFEQVLNNDPECGQAYWGKALCKYKVSNAKLFAEVLFQKVTEHKETEKIKFIVKSPEEVAREEDQEFGYLKEFSNEELKRYLRIYKGVNGSCEVSTQYFIHHKDIYDNIEELTSLIENRDFERALQYKNDSIESAIKIIQTVLKELIGKAIDTEKEKKETAQADAMKAEENLKSKIHNLLKTIESQIEKMKQEAEKERIAAEQKAEQDYQTALAKFESDYQSQLHAWESAKQNYIHDYEQAIANQNSLQEKIRQLESEKANLKGLFTGKRRNEIEQNIKILHDQLHAILLPQDPGEKPEKENFPTRESFLQKQTQIRTDLKYIVRMSIDPEFRKTEEAKKKAIAELSELGNKLRNGAKTISLGFYPYSGKNDIQPIKWRVLSVQKDKALLIAEEGIATKKYNTEYESITWEKCTLRKWLNSQFLSQAFSKEEKNRILNERVPAHNNPRYNINPGNDTTDKIFLLSLPEVIQYFASNNDRITKPTPNAKLEGAYLNGPGNTWWWLRSPGSYAYRAAYIGCDGAVQEDGGSVSSGNYAIRPALWISI